MMIAAVHGIAYLAPRLRAVRAGALWGVAGASLALGFGMFFLANVRSAFQLAIEYFPTPQDRQFVRDARQLAKKYADAPAMSGWAFIGPQVCNRPRYIAMRAGIAWPARLEWAAERLQPGTIILVPTDQFGGRAKRELQLLYYGGRAKLVDRKQYVEAWQWPTDAPPPGTPQALQYVLSGRKAVEAAMEAAAAATNPATKPATEPVTEPAAAPATPRRKRSRQ
jgi:hypothetical protein